MDIKINYHAEISRSRGKTYLKPAGDADLAMLKRINFREGGVLFVSTLQALQKEVDLQISASTLSKLDPFGFLMGDVGIPSTPRVKAKAATKAATSALRRIRVCVDIECKCRGYNCKCTTRVHAC
jgi:hypothetical protein